MPIGGELGVGAPVSRATVRSGSKKGHLCTKHNYKEPGHEAGHEEFHATLDNVFVASGHASTTDAKGGSSMGHTAGEAQRAHQAGIHGKPGHGTPKATGGGMFGLGGLAGHGPGHQAKEASAGTLDGRGQSAKASVLGHGNKTGARGSLQGMLSHTLAGSHTLMGSAQEHAPEQDNMTAHTSRSSIAGGFSLGQQENSNAASWSAVAAEKTGESHHKNPLLEDEHLWLLLGARNLDAMRKILTAGGTLDKLFELIDTDRDGLVTCAEAESAFKMWSVDLAHKADDMFTDEERSDEPTINYSRFVEIFLPVAFTVPEQDLVAHLARQAAAAAPPKPAPRAALQMAGAGQIGRKSLFGAQHDLDHLAKKPIQRKKSIFHCTADFSVGLGAEASAPRSSMNMNDSPKKSTGPLPGTATSSKELNVGGRRTLFGDGNKLQAMLLASGAAGK